jgi:T5SS/PEP-CTERM-associated repeat protein
VPGAGHQFTTLAAANAFFNNDTALDLGPVAGGVAVSLSLTVMTSKPGDGFEESFLLGGAPITDLTWTGASTNLAAPANTDLATASNWQPAAAPDAFETLHFNLPAGGILTGTATGMNADFTGEGEWVLQGATLTLAVDGVPLAITVAGNLSVIGGTIAASGSIVVESATDAITTVLGGAQIGALGVQVGSDTGQSGLLMLSGAGTTLQNTGAGGSLQIGEDGTGVVTVTGGASLTDAAALDILGAAAGAAGALNVSTDGSVSDHGLVVGDSGLGSVAILAGGTAMTTAGGTPVGVGGIGIVPTDFTGNEGNAVIADQSGASGSSVSVSGAASLWQIAGALQVGDAGAGGRRRQRVIRH